MNYKSSFAVEKDDSLMATQNRVCFEILMQEFDTIFYHTFQEVPKIKLLKITIIQIGYVISIDHTDHIIKHFIQEYWVTKTKD